LAGTAAVGIGAAAYLLWRRNKGTQNEDSSAQSQALSQLKQQGNDAFKAGDHEAAINFYTQALELDPTNVALLSNRSLAFKFLKRFDEALQDAEATISIDPKHFRGHERKGQVLQDIGNHSEAVQIFETVCSMFPQRRKLIQDSITKSRETYLLNEAFVFIKPHAVTPAVKDLVEATLQKAGLKITAQGEITAEQIDSGKLIDQHYYSIASKATILKPSELSVPNDKFEETFGLSWQSVLDSGRAFNAQDACVELGLSAEQLDEEWARCKKEKRLVKLGGGFYCARVEVNDKEPAYVFNGFFMTMRSKFTTPGTSIHYYVVQWSAADGMSWAKFRGELLGPTDPAEAPSGSLRGLVLANWQALGLKEVPNTGDNAVHASASPFEGLAERLNWLGKPLQDDAFGRELLATGINEDTIRAWSVDPQVPIPEKSGAPGSLFDALEDMDAAQCVATCCNISAQN